MDRENGKGIVFGVLGVVTLIIAILGASLAYFTATAKSEEDVLQATAATVTISYVQGQILTANNLIPVTETIAKAAYAQSGEDQCIDKNNYKVCGVFRFEAKNEGEIDQAIKGSILTTTVTNATNPDVAQVNEFENLSYVVYDTTSGTPVLLSAAPTKFAKFGGTTEMFNNGETNNVTVTSGSSNSYEILIWLNELSEDLATDKGEGNQDFEQGLSYTGTITLSVVGASDKITGELD